MKAQKWFLFVILTTFLLSISSFGQCSDAGVCAIGSAPEKIDKRLSFDLLYRYGNSGKEDKIGYNSFEFRSAVKVLNNTSILISFPFYRFNNGSLGDANGIGDLMLLIDQGFSDFYGGNLTAVLGVRLATGNANAVPELPQSYQPGLGTNDIIFGLKFAHENYSITAGYQYVEKIFTENEQTPIRRGHDFYLQFAYLFHLAGINFKTDTQVIQRLSKTELLNPDATITEVENTDQMQINLGAEATYPLNESNALFAGLAFPVLKRETNLDGLTRVFTLWAGWRISL